MHEDLGLKIIENFITEEEEREILSKIEPSATTKDSLGRNNVKRFGSDLPYGTYMVSKAIPKMWEELAQRLLDQNLVNEKPNHVTVNEYFTGQGITPHIDSKTSGEIITILCLLGEGTMVFDKGGRKNKEEFQVVLPPRTLIQLRGEIRKDWRHSILPVPGPRYSVVFRHGKDRRHLEKK